MQTTIASKAQFRGVGLHSGAAVRLAILPAPADHGIVFVRTDLGRARIPALWDHVTPSQLCTLLDNGQGATVSTVEHVMAALAGTAAGRAVDRHGARGTTFAGLAGMAAGLLALSIAPALFGVAGYVGAMLVVTAHYALFQAANKDPVIQMNQMQAMIAQGADVLVVNATSVKGQKQMMTQIASQIPVTYIDTSVPGTGMTSVQSDNLTIGRESGKLTAKRFKDMGKKSITMVVLTGPATDEFVGPNRRQGFLDGLKEGGLQVDIKAEQSGDYAQDIGQVSAENMLAANPDTDLVIGLNDSMTLGAYNVINGKDRYKNVYVAAAADGQKEGEALIKEGVARVYTPKDFDLTQIMRDIVAVVDGAWKEAA